MSIIKSILDNDLYKFTQQNAVFSLFSRQIVKYKFIDRNNISYPDNFDKDVMDEIKKMESLKLTRDEKCYLMEKLGNFLPPTFIDFLEGYKFDSNEIKVWLDEDNKLHLTIEGFWYRTILWEVPLMALISELYFIKTGQIVDIFDNELKEKELSKINNMVKHNAYFADFGTRRRYSFENQSKIVSLFNSVKSHVFVGTSNVYLAYVNGIKPIGTHAHEWFMVIAAIYGYKMANKVGLENWVKVYNGNLGTALTDTFTTDVFLNSFDTMFSKLFDGVRHDSGDPFEFADKMIKHYKSMGIDPISKTIVFSDGLNTDLAVKLKEYCVGKIKSSFGIGTFLTNDVGVRPLNMVIKITEVLVDGHWAGAVKISDNPIKHTGKEKDIEISKYVLNIN
jgi:nicotinate phosphoribosyltransferase